jgi:hypothetical protein
MCLQVDEMPKHREQTLKLVKDKDKKVYYVDTNWAKVG